MTTSIAPRPLAPGKLFLTDGGLETTLVFHDGLDLPCFAAFDLLRTPDGRERLRAYYERYIAIAREQRLGFVLESPTWRASADWGDRLGYSRTGLAAMNRAAIALMQELRAVHETDEMPMRISGNIGPRGDAYAPTSLMSAAAAEAYHAEQVGVLSEAGADLISAFTIGYVDEAVGIARAVAAAGRPCVLSFTVETDGRLPSGQALGAAIEAVDDATGGAVAYYMVNCAHPTHFADGLRGPAAWLDRLGGLRSNASVRSHAELDESPELDAGDPDDLARRTAALVAALPQLAVLGGCCGTDHRHVAEMARQLRAAAVPRRGD